MPVRKIFETNFLPHKTHTDKKRCYMEAKAESVLIDKVQLKSLSRLLRICEARPKETVNIILIYVEGLISVSINALIHYINI